MAKQAFRTVIRHLHRVHCQYSFRKNTDLARDQTNCILPSHSREPYGFRRQFAALIAVLPKPQGGRGWSLRKPRPTVITRNYASTLPQLP